jgi:hypothetical protein
MTDADIPDDAKHVLCRSHRWGPSDRWPNYWIKRTLGYKTWATCGEKGRPDIAPLYRAGLIREWFSPWSPPCFVTEDGEKARTKFRKELGYDR